MIDDDRSELISLYENIYMLRGLSTQIGIKWTLPIRLIKEIRFSFWYMIYVEGPILKLK